MKRLRVYIDTSIVGGCLDEEFAVESTALMRMAEEGQITLLVSDLLAEELASAPEEVRAVLEGLPPEAVEFVSESEEAEHLSAAYLQDGVVSQNAAKDALHVATATVARADIIASWNFRHIVHYDKIRGFNGINMSLGYPLVAIHSPKEVI